MLEAMKKGIDMPVKLLQNSGGVTLFSPFFSAGGLPLDAKLRFFCEMVMIRALYTRFIRFLKVAKKRYGVIIS